MLFYLMISKKKRLLIQVVSEKFSKRVNNK